MVNKYKYNRKAGALQEAYHEEPDDIPAPARLSPGASMAGLSNIGGEFSLSAIQQQMMAPTSAFRDEAVITAEHVLPPGLLGNIPHGAAQSAPPASRLRHTPTFAQTRANTLSPPAAPSPAGPQSSLDPTPTLHRQHSMFFYTVEDGQRVLVIERDGAMEIVKGPARIWSRGRTIRAMKHHVAHPGEFLLVRYRDGRQEHMGGPAHVWFDPRVHLEISKEEALPIAAKEAVVVYSEDEVAGEVSRRIVHGPATFIPRPGEWLHTFSWHGAAPGGDAYRKVPNALVFQKLWLMPDQMYHDVMDVRTADDALLTIRLMIFFELTDIEGMLATSHDPIGDFINAATSDVVEFMSRHDFESFKQNTEKLNDLATYKQLSMRGEQSGYTIHKVVYRGYGAPARLQQMHDEAIESRTRLQLQRVTERQAQELEDFKLERSLAREQTKRHDARSSIEDQLDMDRQRRDAALEAERAQYEHQSRLDVLRRDAALESERQRDAHHRERLQLEAAIHQQRLAERQRMELEHLQKLSEMGVDLTAYLTQGRADRVIELRGGASAPHVHLDE